MLLFLALAAIAPPPPTAASGRVSIRILQAARVTERSWRSTPARRERTMEDEQGRLVRLRTIDFE